ncbi:hypothetical protein GJ633_16195 [Halorubrum sp. CBA1125]|uniref:hypothetical protein n=1 Tax=Halorubrum sp. CBA1125 TaxID=2668072 RepID=UPI0012E79BEC|nr:hypothetical protein [Halorubrum sp. CBA1125]MUW15962.1 hypothetical protein [Halorubrum sp. CBA1125]
MRRRTALTAIAGVGGALAGCLRSPTAESESVAVVDGFDGEMTRPECDAESEPIDVRVGDETREFETAATIRYPAPPDSLGDQAVLDYVVDFEEAYVTNESICESTESGHVLSVAYRSARTETFDWGEDAWLVFCRYAGGAIAGVDDGQLWEADVGFDQVVYAVDETGAARAAFDEPRDPSRDEIASAAPDPVRRGELVAVFE